ncbi:MAG TPA: hypothetical protein VLC48_02190 [Gemmatimonadota bacterium]|nr:hypothetical protein [Gemmatimonadota bacterium]
MDNMIRRIFMFLLGVSLGYCTGFQDAQDHERNVFVRIVQRVQNFAEVTVGETSRARENAAEEAGR